MANNQNRFSHQKSVPDSLGKRNTSLDNLNRLSSLSSDKSVNSSETGDLKVLLSNYLRWHHVENHSPLTIRDYQDELGAFIHSLENKGHSPRAQDIAPFDILVYLEELKNRGQAASTIKRTYGNLLAWFNWMVRWDFLLTNPVRKVSRPKEPKVKKGFLAPEHIQSLLDLGPQGLFQGARRRAMFLLLLTTGMRLFELASLKLNDLNWEGKSIRVIGKGSKERVVPFHREAQNAVWRYLAYRRDDHPCVWVTEERTPMGYYGVQQDLHRMFERAGLRGKLKDAVHIFDVLGLSTRYAKAWG
ncbi:MAG: tyrosine-type recombinase/integrase [Dehalococcoidales bacterium]|nr:MAG: tyrosine-type recombinase/integrase [Dehalococcoidales bacterium]